MKETRLICAWSLGWIPNAKLKESAVVITTPDEARSVCEKTISASVPGNFELDMMREGLLEDLYMGANTLKAQSLENLHLYYFTEFDYEEKQNTDAFLCFEGIDTVAEIYIDGQPIGFVENMFHAHRFALKNLPAGKHTLLVHILPTAIYARSFDIPAMCFGMKYNTDSLQIRKAASMFGWDIMPRIMSGGLWKPVYVEYLPKARICDPFTYTHRLNEHGACIRTTLRIETEADFITDYEVEIRGTCGDSEFHRVYNVFSANMRMDYEMKEPKLWWPKNYGEPNLYDVEIKLLYKGAVCDEAHYRTGIRSVWLKRTSQAGDDGDFCFIVNGQRIFVMGTNWVPTDAFPSRHNDYTLRDIQLADEVGCNMIRCWGGNVYPDDVLYDYCDKHGIMVWQDFGLGCGHYPDDDRLCRLMKEEVRNVVIERRNHPSLVLWAGDNECDSFVVPNWDQRREDGEWLAPLDPNLNRLTRDVILRELRNHDATRPYLPSSPYIDEMVYRYGSPAEAHLWGPRDYFKGDYYRDPECHFASEIGYHGCPSPASLKKFIPEDSMPKQDIYEICKNEDWLVHATCIETEEEGNPYAYRLGLMISQVERLFGKASPDLSTFARQSQISQAEADKYFIENFRNNKWRKTGILWWNIVDGWPQVSDAVADWYGCKKIACSYIKRSQQPVCMTCKEPVDGKLSLMAHNDTQEAKTLTYTVENLSTGEVVAEGKVCVEANSLAVAAQLPEEQYAFFLIKWSYDGGEGVNHHACSLGDVWDYERYAECMKKAGFYNEFEGFEE